MKTYRLALVRTSVGMPSLVEKQTTADDALALFKLAILDSTVLSCILYENGVRIARFPHPRGQQ
jgi:hypothetical protein